MKEYFVKLKEEMQPLGAFKTGVTVIKAKSATECLALALEECIGLEVRTQTKWGVEDIHLV